MSATAQPSARAEEPEHRSDRRRFLIWALMIGATMYHRAAQRIPEKELAAVQRLAEWRAPSDALLATPGQEILRTMPRLGESYLNVPVKKNEEE